MPTKRPHASRVYCAMCQGDPEYFKIGTQWIQGKCPACDGRAVPKRIVEVEPSEDYL